MDLDRSVTEKFDQVLDEVVDPQSELTLSQLGLVKKFSYHEPEKTIVVHLNLKDATYECMACAAVDGFVIEKLSREIRTAMEAKFPGWTIEVR